MYGSKLYWVVRLSWKYVLKSLKKCPHMHTYDKTCIRVRVKMNSKNDPSFCTLKMQRLRKLFFWMCPKNRWMLTRRWLVIFSIQPNDDLYHLTDSFQNEVGSAIRGFLGISNDKTVRLAACSLARQIFMQIGGRISQLTDEMLLDVYRLLRHTGTAFKN